MQTVEHLLRKLQKIQSLRARAGTPGEQRAAAEAEERVLARLRGMAFDFRNRPPPPPPRERDDAILHKFSIRDPWTRKLFFALLERDGYEALRYPRQQAHTIRVRAPAEAMNALWREFRTLSARLRAELQEVTEGFLKTSLFANARASR